MSPDGRARPGPTRRRVPLRTVWLIALIIGAVAGALAASYTGSIDRAIFAGIATLVGFYLIISLAWGFMQGLRPPTHCPTCGYDLTGLEYDNHNHRRCPECGHLTF